MLIMSEISSRQEAYLLDCTKTNDMASLFALQLLLLSSLTSLLSFQAATSTKSPQRLVTKLIYHDSIFSPLYNPRDTVADCAKRFSRISNARFAYLQAKGTENLVSNADTEAKLYSDNDIFLVSFSIGQPPMPRLAIMDTGSSLTWLQCKPYPGPVFDPSKSSTYANMSCNDSTQCVQSWSPSIYCDSVVGLCIYQISYADGSGSTGPMATEQLTFGTSDGSTFVTPKIRFGCCETAGRRRPINWRGRDGVMGLGGSRELSIVHSLGSRFSYCIGNLNDPRYRFNQLAFGDWANLEGYSTPLEISSKYFVTLEGMSIGQERIDIDSALFGKVIIDTGSYLTYIPFDAYRRFEDKVSTILQLAPFVSESAPDCLCYEGNMSQVLQGFPVTAFQLANGAELVLDVGSLFFEIEKGKAFCMSISPPSNPGIADISIIGVMAQQNYNFGFDLNEKRLYIQRIDCELLYY